MAPDPRNPLTVISQNLCLAHGKPGPITLSGDKKVNTTSNSPRALHNTLTSTMCPSYYATRARYAKTVTHGAFITVVYHLLSSGTIGSKQILPSQKSNNNHREASHPSDP